MGTSWQNVLPIPLSTDSNVLDKIHLSNYGSKAGVPERYILKMA
jgi:hypothetical protein